MPGFGLPRFRVSVGSRFVESWGFRMGGILPSGFGCVLWKVVELGDSGLWSRGSRFSVVFAFRGLGITPNPASRP